MELDYGDDNSNIKLVVVVAIVIMNPTCNIFDLELEIRRLSVCSFSEASKLLYL
jgi:hypothetical protein